MILPPFFQSFNDFQISYDINSYIDHFEVSVELMQKVITEAMSKGGKLAMKKMRKEAAENGASIILIVDGWHHEKNKPISGYARGVKLTGIAYK